MSASPARWVVVDEADSSIHYTGPWFVASSNDLDSLGNFGPTYLRTSHGTNGTASFDYSFQGSAVNIFGTTNINNSSGTIDPTWECFIDGVIIGSTSPFQYAENNWLLCTWNNNGPILLLPHPTGRYNRRQRRRPRPRPHSRLRHLLLQTPSLSFVQRGRSTTILRPHAAAQRSLLFGGKSKISRTHITAQHPVVRSANWVYEETTDGGSDELDDADADAGVLVG